MKQRRIQGLYLVTDRDLCGNRPLSQVVSKAVKAGVAIVQLREKALATRPFVEEALALKEVLAPYNVPLIINDRIDVALAANADGVHIGQEDMPYPLARQLMGPDAIIGLSVEKMAEVTQAEAYDVDYLGVSPIYETPTKIDTKGSWGTDGLAAVRAASRHPLVAIGGLNASNIPQVVDAGADSVAVVSAICTAPDPQQAVQELIRLF
ncbi:MAG: thiamine phosphate synthase [Chloroflexota bacterium]